MSAKSANGIRTYDRTNRRRILDLSVGVLLPTPSEELEHGGITRRPNSQATF